MKVSEKDVLYVAELANLELTPEECARMVRDLNSILEYVDRLDQLDTTGVPPMAQVLEQYEKPAMRSDEPGPCLDRHQVLEAAPEADGVFFKVPKVIDAQ